MSFKPAYSKYKTICANRKRQKFKELVCSSSHGSDFKLKHFNLNSLQRARGAPRA